MFRMHAPSWSPPTCPCHDVPGHHGHLARASGHSVTPLKLEPGQICLLQEHTFGVCHRGGELVC